MLLYSILRLLANLIFKFLFRVRIFGRQNIPRKGGFILASNHASYLDPIVLGAVCPRKLNFMARHDLFFNPFFSWLISTVGAFPVKRDSADLFALKEAMRRLKGGKALLLFPEGSRRFDGAPFAPQPGIGFLATKLDVPVIPAFIKGTELALPKGARFIRPKQICVYFGRQVLIDKKMHYQDISQQIMENIWRIAQ